MRERSIAVKLKAVVDGYNRDMDSAAKKTRLVGDAAQKVSTSLLKFGTGAVLAYGGLAKAAIDWNSAWAGVTKTVDGSAKQMADLETGLREMAQVLPATHSEIAAVAEAAGQLGVGVGDVEEFTRVMIDLGETTNLSAEQAASSLAQFMNVMGTSQADVERIGSVIVDLGNNAATTEADIVQMAQRLAAAGTMFGMSEADVLSYAAALSSVGVEAEAGGTAVSMSFRQIDAAVRDSGDELELIAKTAGMTSEQFVAAWGDDAAGAAEQFIAGLGDVVTAGGDANAILGDLGMTGIRQSDSLLRLASAGDLLSESLERGSGAWDANSALAAEASKRYETDAARIQIALNRLKDAAIDIGSAIAPAIVGAAEAIADLVDSFMNLPGPVRDFITISGGLLGVLALIAGGGMKAYAAAVTFNTAVKTLGITSRVTAGGLGTLGYALGGAVAAFALLQLAGSKVQQGVDEISLTADKAAESLTRMADGASAASELDESFKAAGGGVQGLGDAFDTVINKGEGWRWVTDNVDALAASIIGAESTVENAERQFAVLDEQLAQMSTADAAAAFQKVAEDAQTLGYSVEDIADLFPQYSAELRKAADESKSAASKADLLTGSLDKEALAAQATADAQKELADQIRNAANAALAASGSEIAYQAALDAAADAVKQAKDGTDGYALSLDVGTEAGRRNRGALDQIASSALTLIDAQKEAGASSEELGKRTDAARTDFIKAARSMGMSSKAAEELADRYGLIPESVTTDVSAPGVKPTQKEVDTLRAKLGKLPKTTRTKIQSIWDSYGYQAAMAALKAADGKVATTTIRTIHKTVYTGAVGQSQTATARADGGMIRGPGGPRGDKIHIMASDTEFMVNAEATAKNLAALEYINSGGVIQGFRTGGYVANGPARAMYRAQSTRLDASGIEAAVERGLSGVTFTIDGRAIDVRMDRKLTGAARSAKR